MMDILKQINGAAMRGNPMMAKVKQMANAVKMARDPQAALSGMIGNNPHLQQVMNVVRQHGNDPMRAFREMAEENGLDPDEILSMLN